MSEVVAVGSRFKTGQKNPASGWFRFDGYTDGTSVPAPQPNERDIPLSQGETFPPIKSTNKACWWKLVRKL